MVQTDAGLDAGYDAGAHDAGTDAGLDAGLDAGVDAGAHDAGSSDGGKMGTAFGDAGCVLPSDFPWDAGFSQALAEAACQCVLVPQILHCFTEDGPRCLSWACPPAKESDGGYEYLPDGGVVCLC